jgi:hypothetical protein
MIHKVRWEKEAATATLGRFAEGWTQTTDGAAAEAEGIVTQSEPSDTSPRGDSVPFDSTAAVAIDPVADDVVESQVFSVAEPDDGGIGSDTVVAAPTPLFGTEAAALNNELMRHDNAPYFILPAEAAIGELRIPAANGVGFGADGFAFSTAAWLALASSSPVPT